MPEERKLATILFADIVGSTTLAAEHDPERIAIPEESAVVLIHHALRRGRLSPDAGAACMLSVGLGTVC